MTFDLLEHDKQSAFISWCRFPGTLDVYPQLKLIHSSLNGAKVPIGLAVKLKKEGMLKGIPDVFLPIARGGYHGLYLEFKRNDKKKLRKSQLDVFPLLEKEGFLVLVVVSALTAEDIVVKYLGGQYCANNKN